MRFISLDERSASTVCDVLPLEKMNAKLFWTLFSAIVCAVVFLFVLNRWRVSAEARQVALLSTLSREIGFAAIMAQDEEPKG